MNNIGKWESKMKDLSNEQSTIPPRLIWDNIATTIQKDKKRRGLYIPFLFLSLLGLTSIGIFYLTIDASNSVKAGKLIPLESELKQTENNSVRTINAKLESTKEKQTQLTTNNLSFKHKPNNTVNNQVKLSQTKNRINESVNNNSNYILNPITIENSTMPDVTEQNKENNTSVNLYNANELINKPSILLEFNPLTNPLYLIKNQAIKISSNAKISDDCPKFNKKKEIKFFAEVEGSYGKPSKTMKENPDNSGLYKSRVNSETPWYNWGFGLHAGVFINNNWTISTGINYTQVKEKFATSQRGYTVIQTILNPNGDTASIVVTTGTLINEAENRFTLIDIPLNLGYEYRANNWGLGLETGVDFNISLQTRGKIFNGSQNILAIEDQNDIYKTSLGMGFHASLVLSRYLSDNTAIYLKPGFKTYLKDWTLDTYPLSTSYNLFMLNLGIRHKF